MAMTVIDHWIAALASLDSDNQEEIGAEADLIIQAIH